MLLRHLHLPHLTNYSHAAKVQANLVSQFLAHKACPSTTPPPNPTIITAQFHPVYTCGRREIGTVSEQQKQYLTTNVEGLGQAEFHEALRGGQTTFHGPGQLVAYPILDLRRHGLSPRCYIHLLEHSVIDTCQHYGIGTQLTDNPGVWVDEDHKICAVGVHLRRNIGSHGVGLNVGTDIRWFERIVACGLEGKFTTSLEREGVGVVGGAEEVGDVFVGKMMERLDGVEEVLKIGEDELDSS